MNILVFASIQECSLRSLVRGIDLPTSPVMTKLLSTPSSRKPKFHHLRIQIFTQYLYLVPNIRGTFALSYVYMFVGKYLTLIVEHKNLHTRRNRAFTTFPSILCFTRRNRTFTTLPSILCVRILQFKLQMGNKHKSEPLYGKDNIKQKV